MKKICGKSGGAGAEIVWQRNSPGPKWPAMKLAAPKVVVTKLQGQKVLFPKNAYFLE